MPATGQRFVIDEQAGKLVRPDESLIESLEDRVDIVVARHDLPIITLVIATRDRRKSAIEPPRRDSHLEFDLGRVHLQGGLDTQPVEECDLLSQFFQRPASFEIEGGCNDEKPHFLRAFTDPFILAPALSTPSSALSSESPCFSPCQSGSRLRPRRSLAERRHARHVRKQISDRHVEGNRQRANQIDGRITLAGLDFREMALHDAAFVRESLLRQTKLASDPAQVARKQTPG